MWCKSTSRLALACLSLTLCATLALAQAQQEPPYRVTYDNGVTIEVIAVSVSPSRQKPFWDPTGAKLMERPYDAIDPTMFGSDTRPKRDTVLYEVLTRVSGVKEKPIIMKPRSAPEILISYPSSPFVKGRAAEDLRVF